MGLGLRAAEMTTLWSILWQWRKTDKPYADSYAMMMLLAVKVLTLLGAQRMEQLTLSIKGKRDTPREEVTFEPDF